MSEHEHLWIPRHLLPLVLLLGASLTQPVLSQERDRQTERESYKAELDQGWLYLKSGKRARAAYKFEEVVEAAEEEDEEDAPSKSELARAYEGLAVLEQIHGKYEEALGYLAKARALKAREQTDLLEAKVLKSTGKFKEAMVLVDKILEKKKPSIERRFLEAKILKAKLLDEGGKSKIALRLYREVEDLGSRKVIRDAVAKLQYCLALIAIGGSERLVQASALLIEVTNADPHLAEAYVARGDLLYSVYREAAGYPSGESEYKKALENCGEVEAALVALFTSRRGNYVLDYSVTLAYLDRAFELNPNSVPALVTRAAQKIDNRDFEGGYKLLKRALAINAMDRVALAEMVTVCQLTFRKDEEKSYAARAALVDPGLILTNRTSGQHLTSLYRFNDALLPLRRANESANGEDYETLLALARALIYSGKGDEAVKIFDAARKLRVGWVDPFSENQYLLQARLDKSYERIEQGNFIFYLHPDEKGVLLPYLKNTYEMAWRVLGSKYGIFPDCKIRVENFARFGDFSVRTIGFKGFGALGACFGCFITSVSPAASELRSQFSWRVTAWHEFAHVLHLKLSKARCPRWLTEGMAVFEEVSLDPSFDRRMERELHSAMKNDSIFKLKNINAAFRGPKILFGYYQGGLIVRHLVREYGFPKLVELLKAYAKDKSTEQIFDEVLNISAERYDKKFKAFVRGLVGNLRLTPQVEEATMNRLRVHVARNPDDIESRLMLATGFFQRNLTVDTGTQLRALKQLDPENGSAFLLRAHMAQRRKDVKEVRRLLKLGFANGGDDFDSRMLYASILVQAGRNKDALDEYEKAIDCWPTCSVPGAGSPFLARLRIFKQMGEDDKALLVLERYVRLNGRDYGAHVELAAIYKGRQELSRELAHLEKARDVDPFDRELHERLAEIYRQKGKFPLAIQALEIALATLPAKDRKVRTASRSAAADPDAEADYQATLRLSLSEVLKEAGDKKRSVREAQKVLENADKLHARLVEWARKLAGKN